MARSSATVTENSFVGGLVTDNTALNFPSNACTNTFNCIFDPTGRVQRRLGIDFEDDYTTKTIAIDQDDVVETFLWRECNGDGTQNLLVVQVGDTLYFYELDASSISAGAIASTIALTDFDAASASEIGKQACSFAYGRGLLYVAHPQCNPFYVTFTPSGPSVAGTAITVQIRDLDGESSDTWTQEERKVISEATLVSSHAGHYYNLLNQGWYFKNQDYLGDWDTVRTDMPSNSDVWWQFKDEHDVFDATLADARLPGNSPAPRGHFILDAFNEDRATVSGIGGLAVVSTNPQRPSSVAFFAGRVWYAGVQSSGYTNRVYFSRVLEKNSQAGQCYQINDPTAEILFSILPTDGGVFQVSGLGTVLKLVNMGSVLLIFATNGIWSISGSTGLGFTATDFSVNKISSIEQQSMYSYVDLDGIPCWWTPESINILTTQDGVNFQVESLSDYKIREFIVDIPGINKEFLKGAYDPSRRVIQWIYRSTDPSTVEERHTYDRILNYNLLTKAFYPWSLDETHDVKLHSVEIFKGFSGNAATNSVVRGADTVIDSSGNAIVTYDVTGNVATPVFKYLVSYVDGSSDKVTLAEENGIEYLDWFAYDSAGTDFTSHFTTAYRLDSQLTRFFQPNYVFVFLEQEDTSSIFMRGVFDYTISGDAGKWSQLQQCYNSNNDDYSSIIFRKLKVRGKGRALQLHFESEEGKPFTVVGWGIWETANRDI